MLSCTEERSVSRINAVYLNYQTENIGDEPSKTLIAMDVTSGPTSGLVSRRIVVPDSVICPWLWQVNGTTFRIDSVNFHIGDEVLIQVDQLLIGADTLQSDNGVLVRTKGLLCGRSITEIIDNYFLQASRIGLLQTYSTNRMELIVCDSLTLFQAYCNGKRIANVRGKEVCP